MPIKSSASTTAHIVIPHPSDKSLEQHLQGKKLDADLIDFLRRTVASHKGIRRINIPGSHPRVAAVLLIGSDFSEDSLKVYDELRVFCQGEIVIERWVLSSKGETCVPEGETFAMLELAKVRVEGGAVLVTLQATLAGTTREFVRLFEFPLGCPVRTYDVEHPIFSS